MSKHFSLSELQTWDRFTRANFINSLSGFKSLSLIGTVNGNGVSNLAVFSNIVHLGADPALIGFINRPLAAAPHTLQNIQETGIYTVNLVTESMYKQAHQTSAKYPDGVSEFEMTGLKEEYREGCIAPFVAESPVQYVLKFEQLMPIELNNTFLVIGSLQQAYVPAGIQEEDGFLDLAKAGILTSLGTSGYYKTDKIDNLPYAKTT
ncbi:flavin oxidoreductase [Aquirufa antheringensis]|jgi:flavin reductase (DIM6/NTAB) family NADH-FMN oxidoreductase RutF|uniref:flavin reductase family protein n=1 Tax=Aquirufa antheringensis TaxID=2516559 RepID=UPI00208F8E53|nr:flavin reductase [Aquirufa antheringensis]MCZ2478255.1 flavin oxidoreductase [Aquirufa antheringensis]USQ03118.1 flavin oxidoreductase [Aquirufa antheringensis]